MGAAFSGDIPGMYSRQPHPSSVDMTLVSSSLSRRLLPTLSTYEMLACNCRAQQRSRGHTALPSIASEEKIPRRRKQLSHNDVVAKGQEMTTLSQMRVTKTRCKRRRQSFTPRTSVRGKQPLLVRSVLGGAVPGLPCPRGREERSQPASPHISPQHFPQRIITHGYQPAITHNGVIALRVAGSSLLLFYSAELPIWSRRPCRPFAQTSPPPRAGAALSCDAGPIRTAAGAWPTMNAAGVHSYGEQSQHTTYALCIF